MGNCNKDIRDANNNYSTDGDADGIGDGG